MDITQNDFAKWAIESALHHAVDLGELDTFQAMAIILEVAAQTADVAEFQGTDNTSGKIYSLLSASGLQERIDKMRAEEVAETDRLGFAWAVEGIFHAFGGTELEDTLFLLRAAASIAATDDQVAATLPGMDLAARVEFMARTAGERVIAAEIQALIAEIESPAVV